MPRFCCARVRICNLEQRHRARSVVIGAVHDLRPVHALMIEVRRHDHPFVLELWIHALRQSDHIPIWDRVPIDSDSHRLVPGD